jgi:hypothetical protein
MQGRLWIIAAAVCLLAPPLAAQLPSTRTIECGTTDRQRVQCDAGGKVAKVRLVRDLSFNRCSAAGGWGWTERIVWADNSCRGEFEVTYSTPAGSGATRRITCGTLTTGQVACRTEGHATNVRLAREISRNRCRQGFNWGFSDSLIRAGNGCRAEFEVTYRDVATTVPAPAPAPKPITRTITCGSFTGKQSTCRTEGQATAVRVAKELSTDKCRKGFSWDNTATLIWAKNGCRAEFEVTYKEAPAAPTTRRITCGSFSGSQVTCKTEGYATGVRLARELSSNRCRKGTNWGNTDSFIWANSGCRAEFEVTYRADAEAKPGLRRITCATTTNAQVQCSTNGEVTDVRLVRELSTNQCRQGYNWGHTSTAIWVNRGCRAEFDVTYRGGAPPRPTPDPTPTPAPTPATRVITCGSVSGSAMSCNAFGVVATARLQRDRSGGRCDQSSSWGLSEQSIWVARGCYADFEVTYAAGMKSY